jgi:hypothetical protein
MGLQPKHDASIVSCRSANSPWEFDLQGTLSPGFAFINPVNAQSAAAEERVLPRFSFARYCGLQLPGVCDGTESGECGVEWCRTASFLPTP